MRWGNMRDTAVKTLRENSQLEAKRAKGGRRTQR